MHSQEREELKKAYPKSATWKARVDRMPDAQVVAVYNRLKAQGRLGK